MNLPKYIRIIHGLLSIIPVLFGLVTIKVGIGVVAGSDPGYNVFRPLLIYNTVMGFAYVITGILIWRNFIRGKYAAGIIFLLNLLVLGAIGYIYISGNNVAFESIRAMIFRTTIWYLLFIGLMWLNYKNKQLSNKNA